MWYTDGVEWALDFVGFRWLLCMLFLTDWSPKVLDHGATGFLFLFCAPRLPVGGTSASS